MVHAHCVSVHHTDPFATPEGERSPIRRVRGRLPSAVTLWTAPGAAGLTVTSKLIADGDPARIFGLIDEESDLWPAVEAAGVFAVTVLRAADRQLADRFAGLMPSPGGLFSTGDWRQTRFGPVPAQPYTWAGCRLVGVRPAGWALLVEGEPAEVELADGEPLIHHRGRYRTVD